MTFRLRHIIIYLDMLLTRCKTKITNKFRFFMFILELDHAWMWHIIFAYTIWLKLESESFSFIFVYLTFTWSRRKRLDHEGFEFSLTKTCCESFTLTLESLLPLLDGITPCEFESTCWRVDQFVLVMHRHARIAIYIVFCSMDNYYTTKFF